MLVATDADLDQVGLDAGSLLVTVEDDLPINNATSVTGAVDEDSLNNVSGLSVHWAISTRSTSARWRAVRWLDW